MKVALVHDYIKEYGGAERVLEALHELYPEAPVFTSVYLPEYLGPHKERFATWDIRTTWLQKIPFKHKLISPFRLLVPFAFKRFDFAGFDVIISSATGAYFPNTLKKGKAKLICYCHTPPRYLYGYATAREWKKNLFFRLLGETANHFLRLVDADASKNVDYYLANSQEVAGRIKKFYRRNATVIYPPVEISSTYHVSRSMHKDNGTYFVTGGRLAKPKHVDLLIKACNELTLPLKVFGKGFAGYGEELRKMAGPTIEFVGEVADAEKLRLMAGAKAYLFASEDEDLGITPIEAMGEGIPVIAYRSGGVQETVVEDNPSTSSGSATGMFFDALTVESLKQALREFENRKFDPQVCRDRAKRFSKERFKTEIQLFISQIFRQTN